MSECCKSIKNKRTIGERCARTAHENTGLCKIHLRQKNPVLFEDITALDPLKSDNDMDPVALEKIYTNVDQKRVLSEDVNNLFTYKIRVDNTEYQRTLYVSTIKGMLENNQLRDPFSNRPFPPDVLENARKTVGSMPREVRSDCEEVNHRINTMLDHYQALGYFITPQILLHQRRAFYITWFHEAFHLWSVFRRENPSIAPFVYQGNAPSVGTGRTSSLRALGHLLDMSQQTAMGTMITLSGLAWVSPDVRMLYPDLISL